MEHKSFSQKNTESGFALLMSLIVVGILISIGLSVLELSIKQVQLSTNARDSEIAFHAANAGMECSRYWRRVNDVEMETGQSITPSCFNATVSNNTHSAYTDVAGSGEAFLYDYEFTWGTAPNDRCTRIRTLVASSTLPGAGLTINNIPTVIPSYTDIGTNRFCEAGTRCTVISVRGYNQSCTAVSAYGTVEREVLLQF